MKESMNEKAREREREGERGRERERERQQWIIDASHYKFCVSANWSAYLDM